MRCDGRRSGRSLRGTCLVSSRGCRSIDWTDLDADLGHPFDARWRTPWVGRGSSVGFFRVERIGFDDRGLRDTLTPTCMWSRSNDMHRARFPATQTPNADPDELDNIADNLKAAAARLRGALSGLATPRRGSTSSSFVDEVVARCCAALFTSVLTRVVGRSAPKGQVTKQRLPPRRRRSGLSRSSQRSQVVGRQHHRHAVVDLRHLASFG